MMAAITRAQESKPSLTPETQGHMEAPTDRKIPVLSRPVRLADFQQMQIRPELHEQMAEIDGFVQSAPSDGTAATQKTTVYVGYTATTLYVVFICFDTDPRLVRTHMARRENLQADDHVSVLLDPFADRRRGVLFSLNPSGVQADAAWTEGSQADYSYDQVWDSEAQLTPQGWMAEFAIPFRSLRFAAGPQGWGVVLSRNLPRNSESDNWPHISTNVSGTLTQEGTLRGIGGVTGSHNLQLNPYGLAQNEKTLQTLDPLNPFFSSRKLEGTAGGDAKWIIRDDVVVDATINPDFSQVESDQPQFTVNQRFPVYFPELRPFFLENANYFATPINLLYTRNIVHPEFGARVTGKIGATNLGLLAIDDRAPGETFAPGDPEYKKRALFAVARVSHDLGLGSSIGAIYTDEEFAGGWNRIGGIDFTARLGEKWTASGQAVESSTRGFDGSYNAGPASYFEVSRQGHALSIDNTFQDVSAGFRTEAGFLQTSNIYSNSSHANYVFFPKHGPLQRWGLEENTQVAFDHAGNRVYHYTTVDPFFTLARSTVLAPLLGENSDTIGPQDGYALSRNTSFTQNFGGLVFRSAPLPQLNWSFLSTYGGNTNYNPPVGRTPFLMNENFVQAVVTLQPFRSLTLDNTYLLDRNFSRLDHAFAFENQILRTKINYQFTRAFSTRVIVEYDSLHANPAETSLVRTKQVATQALLTWLPHPGTAIYLGYNNDLQNIDRSLCNRLGPIGGCDPNNPVVPRSPNYLNDGRQIFLKASYLLRF